MFGAPARAVSGAATKEMKRLTVSDNLEATALTASKEVNGNTKFPRRLSECEDSGRDASKVTEPNGNLDGNGMLEDKQEEGNMTFSKAGQIVNKYYSPSKEIVQGSAEMGNNKTSSVSDDSIPNTDEFEDVLTADTMGITGEPGYHFSDQTTRMAEYVRDVSTDDMEDGMEDIFGGQSSVNTEAYFSETNIPRSEQVQTRADSDVGTEDACRPSIPEFFSGRSVFITGATGFMGKVLVEKLLRSCPGVDTVYLLMRPKRGQELRARFHQLTASAVFGGVRERLGRLVPVAGDAALPGLGLSPRDAALLAERVSVVFHCAADVRFDVPLRDAVLLNARGTRELARLALRMTKLEVLVHVSTAYSNCNQSVVEEWVYPAPADPDQMIFQAETLPLEQLNVLQPGLLKDLPNTYLFSKALAENVIHNLRGTLPVAIFRPSVVCPSYREPVHGWVDTHHGPMGLLVGASMGVLRTVYGDGNIRTDILPVDLAINAMIAVAWDTAIAKRQDVPVYNCTTGSEMPVTWNQFLELGRGAYEFYPSTRALWYPAGSMHSNRVLHLFYFLFTHMVPAVIVDAAMLVSGHKPWLVKLQKRLFMQFLALEYFLFKELTFRNSNLHTLMKRLMPCDYNVFNFNASEVDLYEYLKRWVLGSRRFLLKMDDSSIPWAKVHLKRLFGYTALCTYL